MESSKIMKEADDMYNPEFINVSIFYLFFLQKKIILLIIF
jgi:hypothetical protein